MTLLNENQSFFMFIDIQERLLNAVFNKALVENKTSVLIKAANLLNLPIIVTEQYPIGLGKTVEPIKTILNEENSKIFEKTSFDALNEPEIYNHIQELGKKQVILSGIETHICVHQTAYSFIKAGYEVFVISDACGSRSENEYRAGMSRMKDNGVQILTTEIAIYEILKGAHHEQFKEIQKLIK